MAVRSQHLNSQVGFQPSISKHKVSRSPHPPQAEKAQVPQQTHAAKIKNKQKVKEEVPGYMISLCPVLWLTDDVVTGSCDRVNFIHPQSSVGLWAVYS